MALRVGAVAYTRQDLGALSGGARGQLAVLTGFGLAVAGNHLTILLRPRADLALQRALLTRLAQEVEARAAGITDAELRRLYLKDPQYELTVRHLVLLSKPTDPPAQRRAARMKAEAALKRIRAGEPFARVAGDVSQEPGAAASGGLLPPGRRGTWVKQFWDAASSLKVGQVSGVVESPYGFHVIKLLKRDTVPFREVRGQVLARVVERRGRAAAARQWAQKQYAGLVLEPDSIRLYRSGASSDSTVLAHWPGGHYTAAAFDEYLLTLDPDMHARVDATTPDGYSGVVTAAARNALLASRARAMGVTLDSLASDSIASSSVTEARQWATTLGFATGQSPASVKAAALQALGDEHQDVSIARAAVVKLGPMVRRLYPPAVGRASGRDATTRTPASGPREPGGGS